MIDWWLIDGSFIDAQIMIDWWLIADGLIDDWLNDDWMMIDRGVINDLLMSFYEFFLWLIDNWLMINFMTDFLLLGWPYHTFHCVLLLEVVTQLP